MERPARAAGFTLIELLVALVISGILAGVIFQLLQGQSRFSAVQNTQMEVQQNSRGALELITSELRGVGPDGLREAGPDRIRFFAPRVWGVVCDELSILPGVVRVRFPGLAFPDDFRWGDARWGIAVEYPTTFSWRFVQGASRPAAPSGNSCGALGAAQVGDTLAFDLVGTALPPLGAEGRGQAAYVYEDVLYDIAQRTVNGREENWIRRNGEYLAGPIVDPDQGPGLAFRYYLNGSSVPSTSPTIASTDLGQVTRIMVVVGAEGRAASTSSSQISTDSTLVDLRNRT